jgi:hypothetical protein
MSYQLDATEILVESNISVFDARLIECIEGSEETAACINLSAKFFAKPVYACSGFFAN